MSREIGVEIKSQSGETRNIIQRSFPHRVSRFLKLFRDFSNSRCLYLIINKSRIEDEAHDVSKYTAIVIIIINSRALCNLAGVTGGITSEILAYPYS